MPYRLKTGEAIGDGIRRIVTEQIDRALGELDDPELDRAAAIHQVRKRCKKIRGALRLVRGGLDAYARENAWYRDASRRISEVRDRQVMVETYDGLAGRFEDEVDPAIAGAIRSRLEQRRHSVLEDSARVDERLQAFRSAMAEGRARVETLHVDGDGCDAVVEGMAKVYDRACSAMEAAFATPSPEAFHEWRKRVKYHGYHLRLLHDAWPAMLQARRDETDRLAELLGDHHDLSVLRAWVLDEEGLFSTSKDLDRFLAVVDSQSRQIEEDSRPLGRRLFAEKAKRFKRRFGLYLAVLTGPR